MIMPMPDDQVEMSWRVTPRQVRAARLRLARDRYLGRDTPEHMRKIAALQLPEDATAAEAT
jgi:hypothetical protein